MSAAPLALNRYLRGRTRKIEYSLARIIAAVIRLPKLLRKHSRVGGVGGKSATTTFRTPRDELMLRCRDESIS